MRKVRQFIAFGAVLMIPVLLASAAAADSDGSSAKVLVNGLSSPKGLALNRASDPIIAQGAFGPPGPVLEYFTYGKRKGTTRPITDPATPFNLTDVGVNLADGTGWAIGPSSVQPPPPPPPDEAPLHISLYHALNDGSIIEVLNITVYQEGNLDPFDQEGAPEESNPYGLLVLKSGDALVADAANNSILRVTPDGQVTTVARFDVEEVSTDHLPPGPFPPTIMAESVPTSIALGPGGDILVGELKGFPFRPGTSRVWRVSPDADGALCSVNTPDDACEVFAEGFDSIQDIAWSREHKTLYVYQFAEGGVGPFEEGFATGVFPPAVLLAVRGDHRTELAAGELSQPGGVVVSRKGIVYVTDGVMGEFTGRLLQIKQDKHHHDDDD